MTNEAVTPLKPHLIVKTSPGEYHWRMLVGSKVAGYPAPSLVVVAIVASVSLLAVEGNCLSIRIHTTHRAFKTSSQW